MKAYLTIIFLLIFYTTFGQTNVFGKDFINLIQSTVNDSNSTYYYPTLINKIKTHPDSITRNDVYYLYYGQLVQPGYKGLSFIRNPEQGDFLKLAMHHECKKLIPLGYKIITRSPVDLLTVMYTNVCVEDERQTDTYFLDKRLKFLFEAIFSTGDGRSEDTPIKVADIGDEKLIKDVLRFKGEDMLASKKDRMLCVCQGKDGTKLYFEELYPH